MTGKQFPDQQRDAAVSGATEIDLVRSGLEDTMRSTYATISELWNSQLPSLDLRTAAMLTAVKRIAHSYTSLGI